MNYIAEIRAFYDWLPFNSISADAQALWHALMYLNNKCAVLVNGEWIWRVEFTVSNGTLLSILGFSRTQLDRMRNVLIQSGRIRYRKGKGSQSGTYQMIPFDTHYVAQPVTQTDTQSVTQTGTLMWHKRGPLNNYNNTCNSNYNFSPGGDGGAPTPAQESATDFPLYFDAEDITSYFGFVDDTAQELKQITEKLYDAYMPGVRPTKQDERRVFLWTYEQRQNGAGEWSIIFPTRKKELLAYAFEKADAARKLNWNYIDGILRNLTRRDIKDGYEAFLFDEERAGHGKKGVYEG